MSSNRNSNAQQRRRTQNRQAQGQRGGAPTQLALVKGSPALDILGVALIVLALAMIIALLAPSTAPVSRAMGEGLTLAFGRGALLCPVAIIIFAATFFITDSEGLGGRIALGLALVIAAILGMLSLACLGADINPELVFEPLNLQAQGGYVGAGLAWLLLSSVGKTIGYVILVGIVITGGIVCGFSITQAVTRLRTRAGLVTQNIKDAHERRASEKTARSEEALALSDDPMDEGGSWWQKAPTQAVDAAPTTYLGGRETTVLKRPRKQKEQDLESLAPQEGLSNDSSSSKGLTGKTRLLRRKKDSQDPDQTRTQTIIPFNEQAADKTHDASFDGEANTHDTALQVPEFLTQAQRSRASMQKPHKDAAELLSEAKIAADTGTITKAVTSGKGAGKTQARSAAPRPRPRPGDDQEDYELPPFSMLSSNPMSAQASNTQEELDTTKERLQNTLIEFGLTSHVVDYVSGPIVTTFRIEMGEGERVSKIKNLEDDIALTLAAEKVRIFAPIAGTSYVGIEIPNQTRTNVHLGDVLPYATGGPLEVAIGRDSAGKPVITDIAKMPHMLVAGTTGSGKSVLINSMIMSLLMRTTPQQVRLIMVDPKRVEFSSYNGLPHLYVPVVTDPRQAASALHWAVSEMDRRLKVYERANVRNIKTYNQSVRTGKLSEMENPPAQDPYLVVVIDELSDLMMTAGKDVEASIVRLAQLGRAAGIHLVVATQRPSANVVTGLIKSNIDSRVALKVSSGIDSRVILDETGAERLLGNGDMLFKDRGLAPKRVLGCYTSDNEIEEVLDFIRDQAEPDYHEEILSQVIPGQASSGGSGDTSNEDDPLVWEAAQIVVDSQMGSTSGLQRRLKVGYARAGRIMDMLESKGVVGPPDGSKPREVLLDKEGLEDLKAAEAAYREV